jgi:hypothetical protein
MERLHVRDDVLLIVGYAHQQQGLLRISGGPAHVPGRNLREEAVSTWEYKTVLLASMYGGSSAQQLVMEEGDLTALGAQGWELVAVVRLTARSTTSLDCSAEWTTALQYIFKRPTEALLSAASGDHLG